MAPCPTATSTSPTSGAKRVEAFDHAIRKRLPADLSVQTTVQRPTMMLVHGDSTVASGPQRVRDLLPVEAPALLERRVAFYNVWKPLYRRVEELPLVMCDPYDSETDGRARCMDHSAFEDPTSLPDAPRRESIEVRAMAFF